MWRMVGGCGLPLPPVGGFRLRRGLSWPAISADPTRFKGLTPKSGPVDDKGRRTGARKGVQVEWASGCIGRSIIAGCHAGPS